ncbi:hypothetical protein [Bacillus marinisedimentorum]|uniref:hypothetical protein n=1 Tax=Bacillus marinisedimentorum TaxID=1821260 RepID=UPI0007DF278A|nr:hypothetical protein [Bacillus marinisedimentorum]
MRNSLSNKAAGISILAGAALVAISTLLHPPVVDPWDGSHALHDINNSYLRWMFDHSIMLAGIFLWLLGLSSAEFYLKESYMGARNAARLFISSLSIWTVVLAAELVTLPIIASAAEDSPDSLAFILYRAIFGLGLLSGYFAIALIWIGSSLLSKSMEAEFKTGSLFTKAGWVSGWAGAAGIIVSVMMPEAAFFILPITSGPPFLWTCFLGWNMVNKPIID